MELPLSRQNLVKAKLFLGILIENSNALSAIFKAHSFTDTVSEHCVQTSEKSSNRFAPLEGISGRNSTLY